MDDICDSVWMSGYLAMVLFNSL